MFFKIVSKKENEKEQKTEIVVMRKHEICDSFANEVKGK